MCSQRGYRRGMPITSKSRPKGSGGQARVRIAAAGDIHCGEETDGRAIAAAFVEVAARTDLILLAGDLTTHGEPEQGEIIASACRDLPVPVITVLGNHDWHANRRDELVHVLEGAGIVVLERGHHVAHVNGVDVGVVGTKGFVGGFPGSHLPDFGEPLLRQVYTYGMEEVAALDEGLRAVALCPFRIVLLHYSPTPDALVGERSDIWTFLGTDRLAAPILEHTPDLVLHGHAHAGTFEGAVGDVPVYNVAVPVMGQDFWELEIAGTTRMPS